MSGNNIYRCRKVCLGLHTLTNLPTFIRFNYIKTCIISDIDLILYGALSCFNKDFLLSLYILLVNNTNIS